MLKLSARIALGVSIVAGAAADTDSVIILHTNDLHDHLRPGYDGVGGMAENARL